MASQTLRPHRSPSPSPAPSTPTNNSNQAKLTRQSLGPPPTAASGGARGFSGLGISSSAFNANSQPRHASSSVAMGFGGGRDSLSPRPSMGNNLRSASGATPRPSSEFLPNISRGDSRTPEAEQIDQWFKHLASWEATLEEMAAASTDQNFTEELGAIEQWFRVLSEAERTAALYSLLQHSTPVQIRFFLSVLHHMAQSDPMTALLSPNPAMSAGMQAQMEAKLAGTGLKSPSAGGGAGFPGSPTVGGYLNPETALEQAHRNKLRQNRISAPGTLQPHDRWQGQLDQVVERGGSPGLESERSRSSTPDPRPKSTDFAGKANQDSGRRSPRVSGGFGLGLGQPEPASPVASPYLNGSWASMTNTPLIPSFPDMNSGMGGLGRVNLEDARKFRRPGANTTSRNVSGHYNDDGEFINAGQQPGRDAQQQQQQQQQTWSRSPVLDQYGLNGLGLGGDPNALAGLGMNFANMNMSPLMNPTAAQMLALAQAQQLSTAASFAQAGYGGGLGLGGGMTNNGLNLPRGGGGGGGAGNKPAPGRRSPMMGGNNKSHSPTPDRGAATTGGGAGGGAGVAGPDDVDMRIVEDTASWLRVLRLHKYTTTFEKTPWKEMIKMSEDDLINKGVSAQGARTKFLKVFYNVRTKFDMPHPEGSEAYAPGAKEADK